MIPPLPGGEGPGVRVGPADQAGAPAQRVSASDGAAAARGYGFAFCFPSPLGRGVRGEGREPCGVGIPALSPNPSPGGRGGRSRSPDKRSASGNHGAADVRYGGRVVPDAACGLIRATKLPSPLGRGVRGEGREPCGVGIPTLSPNPSPGGRGARSRSPDERSASGDHGAADVRSMWWPRCPGCGLRPYPGYKAPLSPRERGRGEGRESCGGGIPALSPTPLPGGEGALGAEALDD